MDKTANWYNNELIRFGETDYYGKIRNKNIEVYHFVKENHILFSIPESYSMETLQLCFDAYYNGYSDGFYDGRKSEKSRILNLIS